MTAEHASCVVVGTAGILIRGGSGTGKSSLALALIEQAARAGRYAALVSDDRTELAEANGRIVARPPAAIAGLVELRGRGICRMAYLPAAVVALVIDLVPETAIERMPEPDALVTRIGAATLPRQAVPERSADRALPLVAAALSGVPSGTVDGPGELFV